MTRLTRLSALLLLLAATTASAQQGTFSFFLTSLGPGDGANLGGLTGADAHCTALAAAAGFTEGIWRAYLSVGATPGSRAVNARDRIGAGPWFNRDGVMIARNVADLHSDNANLTKATILTEKGDQVNGRGDRPNRHDILTGSNPDGTLAMADGGGDTTCGNWTGNDAGSAMVGHFDRQGGGTRPTSWNSAHPSRGCSQANLRGSGGDGLFYCFRSR